jgi:hypothetical protein
VPKITKSPPDSRRAPRPRITVKCSPPLSSETEKGNLKMTVIRTKNSSGQPVDKITHADPSPYANRRPNPNPNGSPNRVSSPAGSEVKIGDRFIGKKKIIVPVATIETH